MQGSTIALQHLRQKRYWLGCAGKRCTQATCPGLYMEGHNWKQCWGEVFRIYRQLGKGAIRVGNVIGLYYPRQRGNWFSMAGGKGHKATCPGLPTIAHGFSNNNKWYHCYGEVFKIYARGKRNGAVITDHDDITLCYIRARKWVGFFNPPDFRTCPGTKLPPPPDRYDVCWGEIAELWLR